MIGRSAAGPKTECRLEPHLRHFCRYPPVPFYPPIAFYSAIRLGDPEQLAKVMDTDPYFITQDNGAGAPVHFATTYKQLDMVSGGGQRATPCWRCQPLGLTKKPSSPP